MANALVGRVIKICTIHIVTSHGELIKAVFSNRVLQLKTNIGLFSKKCNRLQFFFKELPPFFVTE